ncbi:MAG TPA: C39 family peptidase [Planctomycetota bacterium]|nr:C39 family peptidase [Planctomycetota bacterium]
MMALIRHQLNTPAVPGIIIFILCLTGVLLISPGCISSGSISKAPELKPADLSNDAVILPVTLIYQKEKHECGLTSVNMLLTYYGVRFDDDISAKFNKDIQDSTAKDKDAGIPASALKEYLTAKGFDVFIFSGEIDNSPNGLYTHIDKGRPLIAMVASGKDTRHYLLVIGYDKPNKKLVLQDPVRGALLLPDWQFNSLWERCKKFTLLAVPKDNGKTADR